VTYRPDLTLSPAQITADQNDYFPTSGAVRAWRLTSDAARNVTGIAGGQANMRRQIINVGANNIVLQNQNVGSTAANRVITGTGADITIAPDDVVNLWYDGTTARWRVLTHY
jgi:hypothetical protein